jgi:Winged helix DNA-binding domain
VAQQVEAAGLHRDGARWLDEASEQVMAALSDGRQATMTELRKEIPLLEGSVEIGVGKRWAGRAAIASWVLTVLSVEGRIVRSTNAGSWSTSRPRWARMESWLGEPLDPPPEPEGLAEMVRLWLRSFGPGTEADIKWWLGSTLTAVRRVLPDVGAVEVDLDGRTGYLLPDDLEPTDPVEPWAALLPALDPTTMGWTDRDWYLGPYKRQLFDTAGNAGPTVWWNGRIVGGWRQLESGEVVTQLLEDIGSDGLGAVEAEAARLTTWLSGKRVLPRFPSPLFSNPAAPAG